MGCKTENELRMKNVILRQDRNKTHMSHMDNRPTFDLFSMSSTKLVLTRVIYFRGDEYIQDQDKTKTYKMCLKVKAPGLLNWVLVKNHVCLNTQTVWALKANVVDNYLCS